FGGAARPGIAGGLVVGALELVEQLLDADLIDEGSRQVVRGHDAARDENRAQPLAGDPLLEQRVLELLLGDQAALDDQLAERAPRRLSGLHGYSTSAAEGSSAGAPAQYSNQLVAESSRSSSPRTLTSASRISAACAPASPR